MDNYIRFKNTKTCYSLLVYNKQKEGKISKNMIIPEELFGIQIFYNSWDNDFDLTDAFTHYAELYYFTLESVCYNILADNSMRVSDGIERLKDLQKPETVSSYVCDFYKALGCLEFHDDYTELLKDHEEHAKYLELDKSEKFTICGYNGDLLEKILIDYYKESHNDEEPSTEEINEMELIWHTKGPRQACDMNDEAYYLECSIGFYSLERL